MSERSTVSDEELGDVLDGRVDPGRREEIMRLMEHDRALKRRYDVLLEQDRLLARIGEDVLHEPVPERLLRILESGSADGDASEDRDKGPARNGGKGRGPIVALVMGLAAGVVGGWLGHATLGERDTGLFQGLVEQAALSHRMFEASEDGRLSEIGDDDVLPAAALPDIFETPVRAAVLRGSRWTPVGLRTETGSAGSAMQIAYADGDGDTVTLYVRRKDETDDIPSSVARAQGYNILYWLDGPLLYALVGDVEPEELGGLARDVYSSRAIGGRWTRGALPAAAPAD